MNSQGGALAGTLESNDILITISPSQDGADHVNLTSIVLNQFGPSIRATLDLCLAHSGLTGVEVTAQDKGALECTIKARMETAIARYKEKM